MDIKNGRFNIHPTWRHAWTHPKEGMDTLQPLNPFEEDSKPFKVHTTLLEMYKSKGFTVYSVSLDGINPRLKNRFKTEDEVNQQMDKAKQKWLQAIEKDGLVWDSHVSDLQHWNSIAAKTYGVRSIPQTFLINRDGTIAAINPRNNLEEALLKIL